MDVEDSSPSATTPGVLNSSLPSPVVGSSQTNTKEQKHQSFVPLQENVEFKANGKKSRSSFRLPGKKKRRERKEKRKTTCVTAHDDSISPLTSSTTHPPVAANKPKREFVGGGLGLLGKDGGGGGGRKSHRRSKRLGQHDNASGTYAPNSLLPSNPVFGIFLELAYERNPSHDGVMLPAFLRYCIDYLERDGLSTEGIYRVPGVNSQVQSIVAALDRGEEFPDIPPTLATYQNSHRGSNAATTAHRRLTSTSSSSCYGPSFKAKSHPGQTRHNEMDQWLSDSNYLPHEVYVVSSVLKQFLRNLPDPVLTNRVGFLMESVPPDVPQMYYTLATLVHKVLPVAHRFLLAWLLQHINNIIDRSRENLMSLGNISIVLSPCLGISHRLLAVLLGPPQDDVTIDLFQLDPSLPPLEEYDVQKLPSDPCVGHWLFSHPIYYLRPYRPPLDPVRAMELPVSDEQIDEELSKQESMLVHLHEKIAKGEASTVKEDLLWEVQRLVTELRRRKALCTPESIRAELARLQTQLDRLHEKIAAEQTGDLSKTSTVGQHQSTCKHGAVDVPHHGDELWELQRQVTMLKRRLRQQEKLFSPQANVEPSSFVNPSSNQIITCGGIPFEIPSVAELDQEEVLNLTLRKLPVETPVPTRQASTTDNQQDPREGESVFKFEPFGGATQPEETWVDQPSSAWPQSADFEANTSGTTDVESAPQSLFVDADSNETSDQLPTDDENDEDGIKPDTTLSVLSPKTREVCTVSDEIVHPPSEHVSPTLVKDTPPSEPPDARSSSTAAAQLTTTAVDQHSQQQLLYHTNRKYELQAINADLCARIRSENAEIQRIQSSIDHLLQCDEKSVSRNYEDHFAAADKSSLLPTTTSSSSTVPNAEHCSPWLNQSWVRIVAQLDANEIDVGSGDGARGEEDSCLIDSVDDSSHSTSDPDIDPPVVSYSRLVDEDDIMDEPDCENVLTQEGYDPEDMDHRFKYAVLSTEEHKVDDNNVLEEDDDEDDDDDECEAELSRTLHQLVLDNARLEQLNKRYLEGIQAERNRCAELKVLLKLRNTNSDPTVNSSVSTIA